jgi:hypothetical protein
MASGIFRCHKCPHLIAEGLRSKFTESYRLYSHAVASARAWEGWEELDTCETERLRGLEELLFSLTSNYNCICNGDKTIWDEHTRTPQHQAALALYESLENCAYDSLAMFERGESIHPRRQENMLEAWSSPVNLAHLESLGCTALFEQCRQRDRLARLLDDRMRREGIDATLDTLRNQRGYLTAALNVLDRRLREG